MTRVKICCIADLSEARMALEAGASALGLVSAMPSGPGVIDEESIATVTAGVPAGTDTFLLTARTDTDDIVEQHRRTGTTTLQLVDAVEPDVHGELRERLPDVHIVQVIHVNGPDSVTEAVGVAGRVDALLLDSGNPALAVKELGGTGRTHDWSVSRDIVEATDVPVYLAGGLDPTNVARAIEAVLPYGLDLCSGVRTGGALDADLLTRFMTAVRETDARPGSGDARTTGEGAST